MDDKIKPILNNLVKYAETNDEILKMFLFGSQARGDYNEVSDVDLFIIANENCIDFSPRTDVEEFVENDIKADVFADEIDWFKFYMNLYGSIEYNVVRDGIVVYEHPSAGKIIGNVKVEDLDPIVSYGKWLSMACKRLLDAYRYIDRNDCSIVCGDSYQSITYSIKAMLVFKQIKFKPKQNIENIYNLLPEKLDHDFSKILDLNEKSAKYPCEGNPVESLKTATAFYEEAVKII